MIVYIDANKYLDFLRNASEDFISLNLLAKHMKKENITLLFPQITQDEFYRNLDSVRSAYMASALVPHKSAIPQQSSLNKDAKLRSKIERHVDAINKEIDKLKTVHVKRTEELVAQIEKLAKLAEAPDTDDELFNRAKKRRLIGNPPGKSDNKFHIGDEIVWELILRNYSNEDVVIISADGDWTNSSERASTDRFISTFLAREWAKKSNRKLTLETNIGKFINDNFKITDDKVPEEEIRKEDAIDQSLVSGTQSSSQDLHNLGWGGQDWAQLSEIWNPTLITPSIQEALKLSSSLSVPAITKIDWPVLPTINLPEIPKIDINPLLGIWVCPSCKTQNSNTRSMCVNCKKNRSQN